MIQYLSERATRELGKTPTVSARRKCDHLFLQRPRYTHGWKYQCQKCGAKARG